MTSAITVCICTYNRSASLRVTLESLAAQADGWSDAELLIVDNNCTDDTPAVVDSFGGRLPIRRVTETRQGLASARNRGVAESRFAVIVFTDDDMTFDRDWLGAYRNAADAHPEAAYFGGRILPDWRGAKPRWIGDKPIPLIEGILGWYDHGLETRPYQPDEALPCGGNFAVRRHVFDRFGLFRPDLGTGGNNLGLGEETELLRRAKFKGGMSGAYVGKALCLHAFEWRSLALDELFRYGVVVGHCQRAVKGEIYVGSYPQAADFLARGCYQLLKGRGDLFRLCIVNAGVAVGSYHAASAARAAG